MKLDPVEKLLNKRIAILDGGFATHLEDVLSQSISSGPLWSASLLDSNPQAISRAHRDFLEAGCQILSTANYQASSEAYEKAGYNEDRSMQLMRSAVHLAALERDEFVREKNVGEKSPLVALSLGPYGALLQNGSEYTGDYSSPSSSGSQPTIDDLTQFHLKRLRVFTLDSKTWSLIDLIAFETIPRLDEAQAIKRALKILKDEDIKSMELEMKPAYLSFVFPDGKSLPWKAEQQNKGNDQDEIKNILTKTISTKPGSFQKDWPVIGVGINCTKPYFISSLAKRLNNSLLEIQTSTLAHNKMDGDNRPYLFLYPDGGLVWDGTERVWKSTDGEIVDGRTAERIQASSETSLAVVQDPSSISNQIRTDSRAEQWAGPLTKVAEEALDLGDQAGNKGWKGCIIGGCCKARVQDIKALSQFNK